MTGIYNWITPINDGLNGNIVLYQEGSALKRMRFSDGRTDVLVSGITGARGPSFADLGPRVYMAAYDLNGYGQLSVKIHDGDFTNGNPNIDDAFRGPLTLSSASATDGGTGQCTAGTHYLGVVFQSRSGFAGRPTTTVSSSPISVTLGSDLRAINFTVTLNTPTDAGTGSFLYPIITRADNPNRWYFVPDASFVLPYNTIGASPTFTISISDEDLAANAEPADDQFNRLIVGDGAPSTGFLVAYGQRMCYGSGTKLYISDKNDPQALTEDLNVVSLPSKRKIAAAFPVSGSSDLFLTGDKWTGRVSDNGDSPATWPQPVAVSDSIGAPFYGCVEWRTSGQYAWVAAEPGLYLFSGTYPDHAITYLFSDQWARINWSAEYAIQVRDDVVNLKCYVAAPLDGATEPTHQFVIDYTNGRTFDTCDITLDNFNAATFSSIGIVKEADGKSALWIGPSAAGNIVHFDDSTKNDQGAAVHSVWESGLLRSSEITSEMMRVGGAHLWIRGNGKLLQTWHGLDRQFVYPLPVDAVSKAAAAVFAVDAHGFQTGNQIFIAGATGDWAAMNGTQTVTATGTSTFTIPVNSSAFAGSFDGNVTANVQPLLLAAGCTPSTLSPNPGQEYLSRFDLSPVENATVRLEVNEVDGWFRLSQIKPYMKPVLYSR